MAASEKAIAMFKSLVEKELILLNTAFSSLLN
jgi:hypothetical protein